VSRRPDASGPRVLYVSSSIGLGHASKDLAIVGELRRLAPGIEILWVAGRPASDVLRKAGENVLPEGTRGTRDTSQISNPKRVKMRTGTPFREASGHPTRLRREVEAEVKV